MGAVPTNRNGYLTIEGFWQDWEATESVAGKVGVLRSLANSDERSEGPTADSSDWDLISRGEKIVVLGKLAKHYFNAITAREEHQWFETGEYKLLEFSLQRLLKWSTDFVTFPKVEKEVADRIKRDVLAILADERTYRLVINPTHGQWRDTREFLQQYWVSPPSADLAMTWFDWFDAVILTLNMELFETTAVPSDEIYIVIKRLGLRLERVAITLNGRITTLQDFFTSNLIGTGSFGQEWATSYLYFMAKAGELNDKAPWELRPLGPK